MVNILNKVIEDIKDIINKKGYITVAIDGNSCSGKSSLANLLSKYFDVNIIHMDDFFLPINLRSEDRLAEVGGNVHYERFMDEIVRNYDSTKIITYKKFDCRIMDYSHTYKLEPKQLTIVEGSYCMRKEFRDIYDYKIFLKCDYDIQLKRIEDRNGKEMLIHFKDKWIPMENKYFEVENIEKECDISINCNEYICKY